MILHYLFLTLLKSVVAVAVEPALQSRVSVWTTSLHVGLHEHSLLSPWRFFIPLAPVQLLQCS